MASQHTALLLQALRCPLSAEAEPGTSQQFRKLVAWLENTQIRQLEQSGRARLLATDAPDWQAALQEYLLEVDCPIKSEDEGSDAVLQWLLHLAVSLAYQDNVGSAQFAEKLNRLKQCLQMSTGSSGSQVEDLQVARDVVVEQLLPSVDSSEAGKRSREAALQLSRLDADAFPLGFATGDEGVDLAGTIMRMLFIKDLRQLQTTVDETLVQVQEFTANPKTDASLGRLGR